MQTIPEKFSQASHKMVLIKREHQVAMYKDTLKPYWEVHLIKVKKASKVFGKEYPEREVLASSSNFGHLAFACDSEDRASAQFKMLLAKSYKT